MARNLLLGLLLTTCAATWAAKTPFVFEERPGRSYTEGEASWRDALLRASVGGCKERLPRGARLRARIRDCVVNQIRVINTSAHPLVCRASLVLPTADDDGRTRVEHTLHVASGKERWVATAYGPASLVPTEFSTSCRVGKAG
jgi:hypothetical protein